MTSLYDLWDEEKYSEGDPIRQLIGATKGIKDWPMDAVAWGADTVDLLTAGLAHIAKQNPGLAKAIKTDLGGNLRRSTKEGYDRPTMTQGPSPDVEEGRSVGRMLNPFLWAGGQKIPTPKMDLMNFNPARRAFLSARDAAYKQPIPEAAEDLGNAAGALLNTPMDRRTFNKSAVVAGGLTAGGMGGLKLMERFAPEAKQAAEAIPKGLESAQGGSHKYHSLKDYLDDVINRANMNIVDNFDINKEIMQKLKEDEEMYTAAKEGRAIKGLENGWNGIKPTYHTIYPMTPEKNIKWTDAFSLQAKKEMKEYKDFVKQYRGEENWSRPDDMMDWINGDRIPF